MFRYFLIIIITIPLLPLLYIQGKLIQRKLKRLPEAEGNTGTSGDQFKRNLSILILGESTMAGVGIKQHQNGFPGTLAQELSEKLTINIHWKVYAKRGFTAKQITKEILPEIVENHFDLIIIGLGGNDTFALRSPKKWRMHIDNLLVALRRKFSNAPIAFLNMPPIKDFPAFSFPLKITLGNLIELLGETLNDLVSSKPKVYFNQEVIQIKKWKEKFTEADFFSDGVHPSEISYQVWAKDFSEFLLSNNEIFSALRKQIWFR